MLQFSENSWVINVLSLMAPELVFMAAAGAVNDAKVDDDKSRF